MIFKPFPELTDILLRELCETSSRYYSISENPSHEPSISPCPQETKSSNSSHVIVITAQQRDK